MSDTSDKVKNVNVTDTVNGIGNVNLHTPNIDNRNSIQTLRGSRKAHAGHLTRAIDKAYELIATGSSNASSNDVQFIRTKITEQYDAIDKCCLQLKDNLTEEAELCELKRYSDDKSVECRRVLIALDNYNMSLRQAGNASQLGRPGLNQNGQDDVHAGDSVSQVSVKTVSSATKLRMEAEEIRLQLQQMERLQQLEKQRLQIKQEEDKIRIETKLKIAEQRALLADQLSEHRSVGHRSASPVQSLSGLHFSQRSFPRPVIPVQSSSSDIEEALKGVSNAIRKGFMLPPAVISPFKGDPIDYPRFQCTFATVEGKCVDAQEKLNYLLQYTEGPARSLINDCVMLSPEQGLNKAKNLLRERYGTPYIVARSYLDTLTTGPELKIGDSKAIQEFADTLRDCQDTLNRMGYMSDANACDTLRKIVSRFPPQWRGQFLSYCEKLDDRTVDESDGSINEVAFKDVVSFVVKRARSCNHPVFGNLFDRSQNRSDNRGHRAGESNRSTYKPWETSRSIPRFSANASEMSLPECFLCSRPHSLSDCEQFTSQSPNQRFDIAFRENLCINCLMPNHITRNCPSVNQCNKVGCKTRTKHNVLLHPLPQRFGVSRRSNSEQTTTTSTLSDGAGKSAVVQSDGAGRPTSVPVALQKSSMQNVPPVSDSSENCTATQESGGAFMQVVPVKVWSEGSNRSVSTLALIDTASTICLCDQSLVDQLGIQGVPQEVSLATVSGTDRRQVHRVSLEIRGAQESEVVDLPDVKAVNNLNIKYTRRPSRVELNQYSHLRDIPFGEHKGEILLLIGTTVPKCFVAKEISIGEKDTMPIAVKGPLGWSVLGGCGDMATSLVNCTSTVEDVLMKQVKRFWEQDMEGTVRDQKVGMSVEDRKALQVMESSAVLKNGHYQMKLPFRTECPVLPNNRFQAEQRFHSLVKRFVRDPSWYKMYKAAIQEYLDCGYAEKVPKPEMKANGAVKYGRKWYLPHHGVTHEAKPGRVRSVFDCAAEYDGTSLNKTILQGPDLTSRLFDVLLRFRVEIVALFGDVKAMFSQVKLYSEHCDYMRFLWFEDDDITKPPVDFRMTVHPFGCISSPSCAAYALQRTCRDNASSYEPAVIDCVYRNFYVDDFLKSVSTEEEAIALIPDLVKLLQSGGFQLTKFFSNRPHILESAVEKDRIKPTAFVNLDDSSCIEKVLGTQWNPSSDEFRFTYSPKGKPCTRRGILSEVASVYDPLGLLAPVILPAKILLQTLCRLDLNWDTVIDDALQHEWKNWQTGLDHVKGIGVRRCYKPANFGEVQIAELHHFCDASEVGYGTCSYARLINVLGEIHCCLITGRSRVAPLKVQTIPRQELQAAVLAVRVNKAVVDALCQEITWHRIIYWTDSTTVLKFISNETRRFQTFVANRLAEIHQGSDVCQWRYVDSAQNVADDVSRGLRGSNLSSDHRWFRGPSFLWEDEVGWPVMPELSPLPQDDVEYKSLKSAKVHAVMDNQDPTDALLHYFSSWSKVCTAVAWLMKFIQFLQLKRGSQIPDRFCKLTLENLRQAEQRILLLVQKDKFAAELPLIQDDDVKKHKMKGNVQLKGLRPFLDDDCIMRVGGRLARAELDYSHKHPIILPADHHITRLIIRNAHETFGHCGSNYVLCQLRLKYYIVKGKSAVRGVLSKCIPCRRYKAKVGEQLMADLPVDRITPYEPPFSRVGIDFFGPFYVRQGRATVKRYGCIATCLAIRAVHVEITSSLELDSFINAFRRLVCRRGPILEARSDRGTNLVGGDKAMKVALQQWNEERLDHSMKQAGVKWTFNTPTASHHGGVWERCIRSFRNILCHLLNEQTITDEVLQTVFAEAEYIMNSRPLTEYSSDARDYRPLTPNDILLHRPCPSLPPGVFQQDDLIVKKRWRQAQYLVNVFWRRWIREYLPTLLKRHKWTAVKRDFLIGDLVLLADPNCSRGEWKMGRITKVFPGVDGLVRSVQLKTATSEFIRPITKICLLEEGV